MLKKLTVIKNLGTFLNFKPQNSQTEWNGNFRKNNIIFAHNGSGKTTLSLIFQSLAEGDSNLVIKKHRITSNDGIEIRLIGAEKNYNFTNGGWDNTESNIKVFNSFYFRDNVYAFKFSSDEFSFLFKSDEDINLKNKNLTKYLKDISQIRKQIKRNPSWTKEQIRKSKSKKEKRYIEQINKQFVSEKKSELEKLSNLAKEISPIVKDFYQNICMEYCDKVNYYLKQFTDYIIIKDIKPLYTKSVSLQSIVFNLEINGIETSLGNRDVSFDFYLSDGDKNAISFASFLARLDMMGEDNLANQIIIFDDPFNSMDSHRKNRTIDLISQLSHKVKQMFVFSHDLYFANDLHNRIFPKEDTLCIEMSKYNGDTHLLVKDNFSTETKTLLIQRIEKLYNFEKNSAPSNQLFAIKSDIRPVLEGMFKIKFYKTLLELQDKGKINIEQLWLKNYIDFIEKSKDDDDYKNFNRLYTHLAKFRNIQNYCSKPHHDQSDTSYNQIIAPFDLTIYVRDTLELVQLI